MQTLRLFKLFHTNLFEYIILSKPNHFCVDDIFFFLWILSDKKYRILNKKMYIDSNFQHLLTLNFTESLFLKCSNAYKILHDLLDIYFRQIFSKKSENSVVS